MAILPLAAETALPAATTNLAGLVLGVGGILLSALWLRVLYR
jgi:hypothetical protein